MLLAHLHEGLLATAIIAIVAGVAIPFFEGARFSKIASIALGVLSGVLVIAALAVGSLLSDVRASRRHTERDELPKDE